MSIIIELDDQGNKLYKGFLSSAETRKADLLLGYLQEEIPNIGQKLRTEYGDGVLYKYFLGKRLGELLEEYEITEKERGYFWKEIKNFAPEKERKRNEGGEANTRKFYEQCYKLSRLEQGTVEKLTWRQWQDLLDRTTNREDERIFEWIGNREGRIKNDEWRSFEKALNLFLKNKDTSVFSIEELFDIYEMLLVIANCWLEGFDQFSKEKPKSAKLKTKSKWETKIYQLCFKARKANKRNLTKSDCEILFKSLME